MTIARLPLEPSTAWTGPGEQVDASGAWTGEMPIPGSLWPCGPPSYHQSGCGLHSGGRFCDCAASDASDTEWGVGA